METNSSHGSGRGLLAALVIVLTAFIIFMTAYLTILRPQVIAANQQHEENSKLSFLLSLYEKESVLIKKLEQMKPLSGDSKKSADSRVSKLLGRVAAVAKGSKLDLEHFEIMSEDRLQNVFNRVTLQVIVSGHYGDQLSFLNTVFRLPLLLDVPVYELSMGTPSAVDGKMRAQMQLEIFYLERVENALKVKIEGSKK